MINYTFKDNKTLLDLFNIINPNCYQALIINAIITDNKDDAIKYCNVLKTAIQYYNWDATGKQTTYIDQLICTSDLSKWQKEAILYIIANDTKKCIHTINAEKDREINSLKANSNSLESFRRLFYF